MFTQTTNQLNRQLNKQESNYSNQIKKYETQIQFILVQFLSIKLKFQFISKCLHNQINIKRSNSFDKTRNKEMKLCNTTATIN